MTPREMYDAIVPVQRAADLAERLAESKRHGTPRTNEQLALEEVAWKLQCAMEELEPLLKNGA